MNIYEGQRVPVSLQTLQGDVPMLAPGEVLWSVTDPDVAKIAPDPSNCARAYVTGSRPGTVGIMVTLPSGIEVLKIVLSVKACPEELRR